MPRGLAFLTKPANNRAPSFFPDMTAMDLHGDFGEAGSRE
jgi:hypothetical protein